jgi:digeranylgeranylglycerophospholipid reductase
MPDVAIVGGGPAGLLTALRCAGAGLDVHLFEEHDVVGEPMHCTGVVSLETITLAKISDDMILARLRRARLSVPGYPVHEACWEASTSDEILAIDRAAFDRSLASQTMPAQVRAAQATSLGLPKVSSSL